MFYGLPCLFVHLSRGIGSTYSSSHKTTKTLSFDHRRAKEKIKVNRNNCADKQVDKETKKDERKGNKTERK